MTSPLLNQNSLFNSPSDFQKTQSLGDFTDLMQFKQTTPYMQDNFLSPFQFSILQDRTSLAQTPVKPENANSPEKPLFSAYQQVQQPENNFYQQYQQFQQCQQSQQSQQSQQYQQYQYSQQYGQSRAQILSDTPQSLQSEITLNRQAFISSLKYFSKQTQNQPLRQSQITKGLFCACRECCSLIFDFQTRSPYCCKQCQVREQNMRQMRVRARSGLIERKSQLFQYISSIAEGDFQRVKLVDLCGRFLEKYDSENNVDV